MLVNKLILKRILFREEMFGLEKKKKPLLTDEFLDELASEINEQFGGPELKIMKDTVTETSTNDENEV